MTYRLPGVNLRIGGHNASFTKAILMGLYCLEEVCMMRIRYTRVIEKNVQCALCTVIFKSLRMDIVSSAVGCLPLSSCMRNPYHFTIP